MYTVISSWLVGRSSQWWNDEDGYASLEEACNFAAWLLERPTARALPGYTVTVVEVGV